MIFHGIKQLSIQGFSQTRSWKSYYVTWSTLQIHYQAFLRLSSSHLLPQCLVNFFCFGALLVWRKKLRVKNIFHCLEEILTFLTPNKGKITINPNHNPLNRWGSMVSISFSKPLTKSCMLHHPDEPFAIHFTNFVQSWIQVYFPTLHTWIRQLWNKNTLYLTTCLQEHKTIQFPGFGDGQESSHQYFQSTCEAHTGHTCTRWHHPTVQYLWIEQEHPPRT
jgi:hypothetical protein